MPLSLSIYFGIVIIVAITTSILEWKRYKNITDAVNCSVGFAMVFGLVWAVAMAILYSHMQEVVYEGSYEEIVFIKANRSQELSGAGCFLGWSVDSTGVERYHVTKKTVHGYKKVDFKASDIYIKECDYISPRIEYQTRVRMIKDTKWFKDHSYRDCARVESIIVPKGTIIQEIHKL